MKYVKYHGLGNDYIVIRPTDTGGDLDPRQVQLICDRNYGVGSDGDPMLEGHLFRQGRSE